MPHQTVRTARKRLTRHLELNKENPYCRGRPHKKALAKTPTVLSNRQNVLRGLPEISLWNTLMTTFDERKSAFESKFAHDEQLRFTVESRANKLLAAWAAGLLGRTGDAETQFMNEVIMADFEEPGREDVFRKVASELEGVADAAAIRSKMDETLAEAKSQIMGET